MHNHLHIYTKQQNAKIRLVIAAVAFAAQLVGQEDTFVAASHHPFPVHRRRCQICLSEEVCGCRSGAAIGAAAVYMCGGGGCIDCCTGYGPGVVALCTPYMFGSSWLLGAGETPEKLFGEFQLLVVAGEVAGESSLLRLRLAFESGCGAAMGSMPTGFFFRCARCFSSMASRPSFVKGFGNTSFMPGSGLLVEAADTITQRAGVAYRVENTLRYRRFECLKSWL